MTTEQIHEIIDSRMAELRGHVRVMTETERAWVLYALTGVALDVISERSHARILRPLPQAHPVAAVTVWKPDLALGQPDAGRVVNEAKSTT